MAQRNVAEIRDRTSYAPSYEQKADDELGGIEAMARAGTGLLDQRLGGVGNGMVQRGVNPQGTNPYVMSPSAFGQGAPPPEPFSDQYQRLANLEAIRASLPNGAFDQQEALYDYLQNMMPQLAQAYGAQGRASESIFQGVPDNGIQNRINIFRQRDREERIYAFV